MKASKALDAVVARIAALDVRLSGDDSPLQDLWEEIKEQLHSELSAYWETYLATMKDAIAGFVAELSPDELLALSSSLKCSSPAYAEQKLLSRLLQRGKKETVTYKPFHFSYFTYPLLDFTAYAKINKRTGWETCVVTAYSAAAPYGEQGEVNTRHIENTLTLEQFEKARERGWPEQWRTED